jgi:hypothetical protein
LLRIFSGTPWLLLALVLAPASATQTETKGNAGRCANVEVFHRQGCPHCEGAFDFLAGLHEENPALIVRAFKVNQSAELRARFIALNRRFAIESLAGLP